MPAVPAIIVGGSMLASAYMSSRAAKKASEAQIQGADAATQAELQMYYQSREDLAPFREAGYESLEKIQEALADPSKVTSMPGYEFRRAEGEKGINKYLASRGQYASGGAGKALVKYGQDYATNEYDKYLQRYYNLAGLSYGATAQTAQAAQQTGAQIGANYMTAGNARASGYINQANIGTGTMQNLSDMYMMNYYLGQNN